MLLGNGDGTFQPRSATRWGLATTASWPVTSTATAAPTWPSRSDWNLRPFCWQRRRHVLTARPVRHNPRATPLVADVNGDGTDDVLVVDGAGNILYRQGVPGQPGTFEPPVTINPGVPVARHRLGSRTRIKARCWPASTPTTTRSRSMPSATAASSASDRWRPAACRRRSSRPT